MRTNARLTSTIDAFSRGLGGTNKGSVQPDSLGDFRRGIEKESLRVAKGCQLAKGTHPKSLGASFTHPQITTDFSEAQLELITGVHSGITDMLNELSEIHQFVYQALGDDLLWSASMPCIIDDPNDILIGQYGSSNMARLKTIYRLGLGLRYGKPMQMISGIHFNFSLSESFWRSLATIEGASEPLQDFKTRRFFDMIRNFQRSSWLLIYLFGASPAVSRYFPTDSMPDLQEWDDQTLYLPYATSLRMGRIGYQSSTQDNLRISFNDLESYSSSLMAAISDPYPPYADKGIKNEAGEYQQLSTSLLQIENEFYSPIRPKCTAKPGERPLNALTIRGVEYVEVRLMDVNPFLPMGIDESTIRFLDLFLLQSLLIDSPPDSATSIERQNHNRRRVVEEGRAPNLTLTTATGEEKMINFAEEIFANCLPLAQALDKINGTNAYMSTLTQKHVHLRFASETPSGQMMGGLEAHSTSFCKLAMNQSLRNQAWFQSRPLSDETNAAMRKTAEDSLRTQHEIEKADNQDFEIFRKSYLEQHLTLKSKRTGAI